VEEEFHLTEDLHTEAQSSILTSETADENFSHCKVHLAAIMSQDHHPHHHQQQRESVVMEWQIYLAPQLLNPMWS